MTAAVLYRVKSVDGTTWLVVARHFTHLGDGFVTSDIASIETIAESSFVVPDDLALIMFRLGGNE